MADGKVLATGKVGAEVSPEQAKELAQRCALSALAASDALVGLANVVKRLEHAYGTDQRFDLRPAANGGTEAVIVIPARVMGLAERPR